MATSLFGFGTLELGWAPFLGFSAGDESGVCPGVAVAGAFRAAGVTPIGERRSRNGPADQSSRVMSAALQFTNCMYFPWSFKQHRVPETPAEMTACLYLPRVLQLHMRSICLSTLQELCCA